MLSSKTSETSETIKRQLYYSLPWLIIAFGLALRLDQYLFNRSLWLDEAFFAVNFSKDLSGLLSLPQDYSHNHIAPPGFLVASYFFVAWLGNADWVLRLFPFIMSVIGLVMFYFMAKHYVSQLAALIALWFFAISDTLIDYASDFKQYTSDVTLTIGLLWLAAAWRDNQLTVSKLVILTVIGILAPWFSHASVFILATVGSYFWLRTFIQQDWRQLLVLSLIIIVWLSNFAIMYTYISHGGISASPIGQWLLTFWRHGMQGFMPAPWTEAGIEWLKSTYISMFHYPADLGLSSHAHQLPAILFIVGCLALLPKQKYALYLLLSPIFIALIASYLEKYPFASRLILFLVPIFYLVIAEGIAQLRVHLQTYQRPLFTSAVQILLFLSLLNWPFDVVFQRQQTQEIKPILAYLQAHRKAGEKIYLYHWVEPAFRYYAPFYEFDYQACHLINPIPEHDVIKEVDYFRQKQGKKPVPVDQTACILGVSEFFKQSKADLQKLQENEGRVWFVFSHINAEKQLFLNYLDQQGDRLDKQIAKGASTYLYTFPQSQPDKADKSPKTPTDMLRNNGP